MINQKVLTAAFLMEQGRSGNSVNALLVAFKKLNRDEWNTLRDYCDLGTFLMTDGDLKPIEEIMETETKAIQSRIDYLSE